MGEYDEYKESEDTSEDQSEQELWAVTWDMNSIEEDTDMAETSTEQSDHSPKDTDIDNQYCAGQNGQMTYGNRKRKIIITTTKNN
jgi:hypothetical protein